ncbi:MAG: valyl-tRNA synthetase [Candidatus Magasanikbacteria bacterium]|nr:valyl-tRNA synthetase [Candidatus Magasanikbacteria bacterium]
MPESELPKVYNPADYEDEIYARAEQAGFFKPETAQAARAKAGRKKTGRSFSMVMPPPNATGTLHIGHAVMLAIQDILVRYHRMLGDETVWIPGTDHAAIATQSKVERLLWETEKKMRHDLGHEEFLKRVDAFVADSRLTIRKQIRKMGASCDWSRECFTLDEPRSLAVRAMFKKMYDDGLIYRGSKIVNWDPFLQTTVSDDELEWQEEKAPFYFFKYGPFVISTARPETKFGDKYVVMHPADARYAEYQDGQKLEVEWINGKIIATIIKDPAVDMNFGTGVMTITPWHDATDFEIAERHGLDKEPIIDFDGRLLPVAGEFAGMKIAEARQKIVEKLAAKKLLDHVDENYVHRKAVNSRGNGLIEPQIKEQWFINVNKPVAGRGGKTLKELMRSAVSDGGVNIVPERFKKIYFHWIDNLRDWNISRQIWYGHKVPIEGDDDTLDTWFSSGLWTFSTLGWPEETNDLKKFHPTSVLETGYDILFFWVARMILMSMYALGEVPFRTVYLHGLVRDEQGRKMSKSLGNVIDPLDVIAKYGTDAVRLSLVIGTTPGNDTRLSEEKIAGYRNFTNKLWNIGRFIIATINNNGGGLGMPLRPLGISFTLADKWIMSRLDEVIQEVTGAINSFDFSRAGEILRDFTWGELADWYLEIAKIEKNKGAILERILQTLLKLWHPFMPFVTEVLWREQFTEDENDMLMLQEWPETSVKKRWLFKRFFAKKDTVIQDIQTVQDVISAIRNLRAENKIEPAKKITVMIAGHNKLELLVSQAEIIKALGRVENLEIALTHKQPPQSVATTVKGMEIFIPLVGLIDLTIERERLQKEIAAMEKYIAALGQKFAQTDFTRRAPKEIVEMEKNKLSAAKDNIEKLQAQLNQIK